MANDSTSSCLTRLEGDAPSAMRTAISRLREMARANNRFATFAHAITNTNDTTMSIARKMTRPLRGIISS